LLKDIEPDELANAIRVVARGDALLSPSVTRRLIATIASRSPARAVDPAGLALLTEREREVLALVGAGLSNEEIASELYMSPLTAKTPVSRTMAKLSEGVPEAWRASNPAGGGEVTHYLATRGIDAHGGKPLSGRAESEVVHDREIGGTRKRSARHLRQGAQGSSRPAHLSGVSHGDRGWEREVHVVLGVVVGACDDESVQAGNRSAQLGPRRLFGASDRICALRAARDEQ